MSDDFDAAEKRLEEGHPVGRHASCGILGHYYDPCDIRLLLDKVRELGEEIERLTKHRGLLPNVGAGQMLNPCVCQACLERRAREAEAELAAERERAERLEKALREIEHCNANTPFVMIAREALRPAAPSAQHVEMDEGESCSCGWTSHTKAWRAHAAHMRRRGETTSENSLHRSEQPDLPLGHEFEPCPSLMPDGFPARFCVLKSPKQTECHFWHLHPAHYCGQPESVHRRKP